MKFTSLPLVLLLTLLVGLFSAGDVSAQSVSRMRDYLHLRDALVERKTRIEKELTVLPQAGPLATRLDTEKIHAELAQIDEWINQIGDGDERLAEYYRDRIARLVQEIRALLPVLARREASLASLTPYLGSSTLAITPPPALPPGISTTASSTIASESLKISTAAVPTAAVSTVASSTAAVLSRIIPDKARKAFFANIGVRTLLPLAKKFMPWATMVGKEPPASPTALLAALTASGPVSLGTFTTALPPTVASGPGIASQPVFTVPVVPEPVTGVSGPITVLQPSTGSDPQIRQEKAMRPLAIMIENHAKSRPQTALNEAELVYEIPVEGGITRFMAVFYHVAGIIGPIRSCRDYFIDRALEVNALYVHCGGSPQGYQYIGTTKALAIDEISNGDPYFRDSARKAPHNLYAKMQDIIDYMAKKWPMELPYQRLPLRYGDSISVSTIPCRGLSIKYHGNYTVVYKFDGRHNVYFRYMNGVQHLDRITGKPVAPGTLIVQMANMKTIDEKGRQDISFIGKGRGYVLHGGVIIPVIWEKTAPREFTRIIDEKGQPIIFDRTAPVWVQVVSPKNPVAFDPPIPQPAASNAVSPQPPRSTNQ